MTAPPEFWSSRPPPPDQPAMIKILQRMLAAKKRLADPSVLAGWQAPELFSLSWMVLGRMLRGFFLGMRFNNAEGLVLCERGVRVYHARHISAGRGLNLEEGCEIVGLSKRGIVFGNRCTVGRQAIIRPTNVLIDEPGEGLKVGDRSNIGAMSYIGCSGFIEIGKNVMMGPRVSLLAENHNFERTDIPMAEQGVVRSFIKIEDNCWIGSGSTILAGVTVGHDSIIAAGTVVTKDVPPWSIAAGVPARVIRDRRSAQDPAHG